MKISHICLSNFYIDNFSYQENLLSRQNKLDGNDVQIIASTETYGANQKLDYVSSGKYINEDGVPVIRLDYKKFLPHFIMKKLRIHNGVFGLLQEFQPDVIVFHGLCGWELLTVVDYKKKNPKVKIYADSHEDANNSARNLISRVILHRIYYRSIVRRALPYIDKILFISMETKEFIKKTYGIPESAMEFFPLGGIVYDDENYMKKRSKIRENLGLTDNDIMIIQAGKMGKKKKVIESIQAFQEYERNGLQLFLIGSFDEEIEDDVRALLQKSSNIFYAGWKESSELMDYLCAADVYLQPGSQSAIMQNALCLRCPVILDDVPSHQPFVHGNGWVINDVRSISDVLNDILRNPAQLEYMSTQSLAIARKMLDYKKLAARLYVSHNR